MVLNNGIEFAVTYPVMLLSLLFTGGGRYVSVDYYLSRRLGSPVRAVAPRLSPFAADSGRLARF